MADFNLDDYVDVAERIDQFNKKYPLGSLQSWRDPYVLEVDGKSFMVYAAAAYRTPDDGRPGIGWAWEPVPGPTAYTRQSELQNAETAAWGRAIVALGEFKTKHVASRQEVRNRQPEQHSSEPQRRATASPRPLAGNPAPAHPPTTETALDSGQGALFGLVAAAWPTVDAHVAICMALNLPSQEEGAIREHWLGKGGTWKQAAANVAEVRRREVAGSSFIDAAQAVDAYGSLTKARA